MKLEEHAAKGVIEDFGIAVPRGALAGSSSAAVVCAASLGSVVVKAQVPTGKRGKAGGIIAAETSDEVAAAAKKILGMEIGGYQVAQVLIEERADLAREFYAAVMTDTARRLPIMLFSAKGGMDIEEVAAQDPDALRCHEVDIKMGFDRAAADALIAPCALGPIAAQVADLLVKLYRVYRERDAELVEINPLAATLDGRLVALDCKFLLDDSAAERQAAVAAEALPEPLSGLEARGQALGLKYIELDGEVGLLANGAGLTMTTMDTIAHYGGRPANFLEIGGEAYTKAVPALELVLDNPRVRSLLVNFCGAFARCDVMTEGVITAWETLKPRVPVFFSIHGTGGEEAVAMVRQRLGLEPFDLMDDAVKAAIEAAR